MDKAQKDRVLEACETLTYMECSCCFDQGMYNLTQLILFPEDLPVLAAVVREDAREEWADAEEFECILDNLAEVCRQFCYPPDYITTTSAERQRLNALGALLILGRFDIIQDLPGWALNFSRCLCKVCVGRRKAEGLAEV